jgi:hypothetical protein
LLQENNESNQLKDSGKQLDLVKEFLLHEGYFKTLGALLHKDR